MDGVVLLPKVRPLRDWSNLNGGGGGKFSSSSFRCGTYPYGGDDGANDPVAPAERTFWPGRYWTSLRGETGAEKGGLACETGESFKSIFIIGLVKSSAWAGSAPGGKGAATMFLAGSLTLRVKLSLWLLVVDSWLMWLIRPLERFSGGVSQGARLLLLSSLATAETTSHQPPPPPPELGAAPADAAEDLRSPPFPGVSIKGGSWGTDVSTRGKGLDGETAVVVGREGWSVGGEL